METTFDSIRSTPASEVPARRRWGARLVTGIPVLFLAFDVAIKLVDPPMVAQASAQLGLPADLWVGLGLLLRAPPPAPERARRLLERLGRHAEARREFERAAELATNARQRTRLLARAAAEGRSDRSCRR